ncbi:MAG: hypothetical protein AB7U92_05125 [Piscinibacter sp.]|jgi:hypothetical protein|uniref:hypothetical protein n=1 Tax=Piscinibacter sp. TaxID=1903157 RepID=UPI00222978CA|nr:hypothetical protein [uncultured Piscinibacter sp.]MCC7064378.1 hypothetical protein [Planctomycetota bacterium]MCL4736577.1 hypothetical protein [Burkholderiaceae bacterium]
MARFKMAAWTFGVVGALAAATVSDRGAFVIGFFWLMFGGIAGLLVLLARRADVVVESPKVDVRNPFTDQLGVHRYPGDVLDVENHPTPGAHGRY